MADTVNTNNQYKVENSVKSLFGIVNMYHGILNIPYEPKPETTLNNKYNILPSYLPEGIPNIKYFGIGINGCYNADDTNAQEAYYPRMSDLDLYNHIPIRLRPYDEDLSASERSKYRLRVPYEKNGVRYWAYYLKMIDFTSTTIEITRVDPTTKQEYPYEISSANLNPTPQKPSDSGLIEGITDEINVSAKALIYATGAEITEVIGVLYDGDLRRANISEIGIYTGEDRTVTGYDHENISFDYTESIYVQIAGKTCSTNIPMYGVDAVLQKTLVIGSGNSLVLTD